MAALVRMVVVVRVLQGRHGCCGQLEWSDGCCGQLGWLDGSCVQLGWSDGGCGQDGSCAQNQLWYDHIKVKD